MENFAFMNFVWGYFAFNFVVACVFLIIDIRLSGIKYVDPAFYVVLMFVGGVFVVAAALGLVKEWWKSKNQRFYIIYAAIKGYIVIEERSILGGTCNVTEGYKFNKSSATHRANQLEVIFNIKAHAIPCSIVDGIVGKDGKITVEQFNNLIEA
jgi:hypothetical protein